MEETTLPLFRQIAALVEDSIVDGSLVAGERAPSTNELAAFHNINPATARKGLTLLVDTGILEKQRGIGMFVTATARETILRRRREAFAAGFLAPLIDEAVKLGMSREELHTLTDQVAESRGLYS
ncbi:GntR family transcriptional regulator [Corynebacterium sp. CCM 8835]|uniref:GntR family transcriptional regulator n=1 Tax=Corynebacterium antarcticum TaxID=2800405 RepID=A0A9Q4CBK8_9CORY|nr:GntR family transcriptional regulator [Corynebacterium antarcticum]MCK7642719.1 GntR family transcriptional regulator [Corynebacterium antarcticum]MCK7660594.1 GntR family transcriptional regulator [Corynebacterium antarcticum]MCL0245339.1 GntR family transcriptional regulator [Corynebacterium antarcticum]MCX7492206.1 GntR family transcriptional regulator [Corynebacterium antarcticum]MCX7537736.1 GntR family transcriptional regulator [Corynebacterium antarcticum]